MAEEWAFAARRILVAVDASAASLDALAAAASLAARLGSELRGVFVEDEDLLRFAGLPFAGIIRTPGGERERIDRTSAEVALRAAASRAREALERAASRHGVAWSFRVSRGRVAREVLSAAADADLVVLGAAGHGRRARGALGETARLAAAHAPAPVLLLDRGTRLGGAVVAVDDGTPAGSRALTAARLLASDRAPPFIVDASEGGLRMLVDPILRRAPALAVLPARGGAVFAALVKSLLASRVAVLIVR